MRWFWLSMALWLAQASPADSIYVVRRGWHMDIGFSVPELVAPLRSMEGRFPGARYLIFGFGDRHYLMAEHSHGPAMMGALWPGRALILATGLTATPQEAFGAPGVVRLEVSSAQSRQLQDFIVASLRARLERELESAPADDPFSVAAPGPYSGSLFFESSLKYSAVHTCNTWAAEALHTAGLPIRSRGTLFAGQLWKQVNKLASHPAPGAGP